MNIQQITYSSGKWVGKDSGTLTKSSDLVLCFGKKELLASSKVYEEIMNMFPGASVIMSSTAGEIHNHAIQDDTCVATAIEFNNSSIVSVKENIEDFEDSYSAGTAIVEKLPKEGLRFVFVLSDGQLVNGSDLVAGINKVLGKEIPVAGGLAGDGAHFRDTLVGLNDDLAVGNIVAVGFYGEDLVVGCGSKGGWGQFGPTRTITRSEKNVLYEIDGENALDLYKKYLGEYADQLPGSALLFPLSIEDGGQEIVRTILSVDPEDKSMTFAGNVPEGAKVRLMKANLDSLVDAASDAASISSIQDQKKGNGDSLAILISCVGRKIIFGNRIEEELDAAREILGDAAMITGFYSYGEISPFSSFMKCELHNQTMTITHLSEN
ncbi:MAG: FIST N-terminal domain-containing protein [Bacteroidota bacterium]